MRLKKHLQETKDSHNLDDLAYTLSERRSQLAFRVAVSATNISELIDALDQVENESINPLRSLTDPKICFVFTGE